jgi:predicted O-methyltransferase YrrM
MFTEFYRAGWYLRHLFLSTANGHGVHSPFAFSLCEEVFYNGNSHYAFEQLNKIRRRLENDNRFIDTGNFGAGSRTAKGRTRKISDIARRGTSSRRQSEILYRLANFLGCKECIELGTSLGLNALYIALAGKNTKVTSIEGSGALAEIASGLAKSCLATNLNIINGTFEEHLPRLLGETMQLDLFYVDGNHTREATLGYFRIAIEKAHPGSVFVFDDVYWSRGMAEAWKEIRAHPSVKLTIDTFHSGYVFFRDEIREPVHLRLRV